MTPSEIEAACRRLRYAVQDRWSNTFDTRLAFVIDDKEFDEYAEYLRGISRYAGETNKQSILNLEVLGVKLVRRSKLSELPPPPPPREWTRDDIRREILALVQEGKIPTIREETL